MINADVDGYTKTRKNAKEATTCWKPKEY